MTAKKKGGSLAGRLERLEEKKAARVEEVEAVKAAQVQASLEALDAATLEDLRAWNALGDDAPAWAAFVEVVRKLRAMHPDTEHPARVEASAWCELLEEVPEGVAFPVPDKLPDFVAYFDEEARRCGCVLDELAAGAALPDGVTLEEAGRVFRYARAGWRLWAAQGRVMLQGGVGQP